MTSVTQLDSKIHRYFQDKSPGRDMAIRFRELGIEFSEFGEALIHFQNDPMAINKTKAEAADIGIHLVEIVIALGGESLYKEIVKRFEEMVKG